MNQNYQHRKKEYFIFLTSSKIQVRVSTWSDKTFYFLPLFAFINLLKKVRINDNSNTTQVTMVGKVEEGWVFIMSLFVWNIGVGFFL